MTEVETVPVIKDYWNGFSRFILNFRKTSSQNPALITNFRRIKMTRELKSIIKPESYVYTRFNRCKGLKKVSF